MFLTVFFQMISLGLVILCGYFIGYRKMMDSHTMAQLSGVINLVFNPMLGISSAISSTGSDKGTWFKVFAVAICVFLFCIFISFPLAPRFDKRPGQKEMYQMMMVFSNLGFMGIPVVKGVYGAEYTVYVLAFMMAYSIFYYTFGAALMNGGFTLKSLKGMLNPGSISSVLAIVLFLTGFQLPSFLAQSIEYLGGLASPLAMLAVGITVASADLKAIFTSRKVYVFTFLRMIVLPLIAIPILKLLPLDPILIGICLIEIAMPVGNLCLIIGTEKGIDCTSCSANIIMTTLLSVITVPVLVTLL